MIKYISLKNSRFIKLTSLDDGQIKNASNNEKGWSFSYVYHLTELRDVFLLVKDVKYNSLSEFSQYAYRRGLRFVKTPWTERRILEQLNALKNFGLLNSEYDTIYDPFGESQFGSPLTAFERQVFKDIYFSYFRFKEMLAWFLDFKESDIVKKINMISEEIVYKDSKPLFPFLRNSKFTNSFLTDLRDGAEVLYIANDTNSSNEAQMRFWDVFVKWGQELDVLEKFNLKNLDYELADNLKSLSCVYVINPFHQKFDLYSFIKSEYEGRYIPIPKLVLKIALKHRYSIDKIKEIILSEALANMSKYSLQRTSEIFIRNTEINFVPKYKGSYISHLLLQ